ncbi:hypothetical protein METBIDRAFT_40283 [Metschnikowia bicuspidata var. bicuspidata NRRL YB-4993]|uniref:Protein EFR3 n=1 Tax=Metschnikowia bicuspidata var. bicuspidata NRRL YB-4993 TaxID=869754 RepID=A0A1A0HEE6_9ASCO|nr:hypothetical protein METBIDRAFT_40283 [Metschnikowia bicuspidata var. bicuspidata NRRL YB-4993]OBA22366.1 hypothetical protein METBIDRAFT_40283 [Metschnikowia bicuspidata var. bicuspidata NRRL YB-4993]
MKVLRPKHQKLILQCYPPGKAADKKPNPLELLYLLYYASTRRVKLEKVVEFLKHKTRADVRGRRPGNLVVTLSIVLLLIATCADNLNAFAPQVCLILHTALGVTELPLYKALVATYGVFCARLDNGLFAGDKGFVDAFAHVTRALVAHAQAQLARQPPRRRDWLVLALRTCRHAVPCVGLNAQLAARFVPAFVAVLAPPVHAAFPAAALAARLRAALNVEQGPGPALARLPTARSHADTARADPADDAWTDADLGDEALRGLRALFHTSLAPQIAAATRLVVEHDFALQTGGGGSGGGGAAAAAWGPVFLQVCASYIPVQLRFETLLTLVATLSDIAGGAAAGRTGFLRMRHYATHIRGLVALGFNMIGLSISDILAQFLALKTSLHGPLADALPRAQAAELSAIYSECICNLASHIYYSDQVLDAVEGILLRADSVLRAADPRHARSSYRLVLDLLDMIARIMDLLAANASAIAWNHASLEAWEPSFRLLGFARAYPDFAALLPRADVARLQAKYLDVVRSSLGRAPHSRAVAQGPLGMPVYAPHLAQPSYLQPNYKGYIEDPANSLTALLLHCGDYFAEASFDPPAARTLAKVLGVVARLTGVNFAHNFLPFFAAWQLQAPTSSAALVARDLCAYYVLTSVLESVGDSYAELLDSDIASLSLSKALHHDIELRRPTLWTLASASTVSPLPDVFAGQITVGAIEQYFAQTSLKQWLLSPNTLLADFEDAQGHKLAAPRDRSGQNAASDAASLGSSFQNGRLGLGTANDISSIYSGLQNTQHNDKAAESGTPDTSHVTHVSLRTPAPADAHRNRRVLMPRVEDLKLSVEGTAGENKLAFAGGAHASAAHSILLRQLHTTDVMSILDDLKSDDDREIVV